MFLFAESIFVEKKIYPHEKKALTFFHAEPLFEQKHVVFDAKHVLLESEKLHKMYVCAVFEPRSRSFDGRLAARTCLPASISQFLIVKESE